MLNLKYDKCTQTKYQLYGIKMIVKNIFLAMFIVTFFSLKSICSMDNQESLISIEDVNKLRHCLRGEGDIYLITANLTSNQFDDKKDLISDIQAGINRDYFAENLDCVDKSIKGNFLNFYKESKLDKNIDEITNLLNFIKEKGMTYDGYINFAEIFKTLEKTVEVKFFKKELEKQIIEQKDMIKLRGKIFFNGLDLFIKENNLADKFVICVTQEAFLNYFDNPNGIGDFIPFERADYDSFIDSLKNFSKTYSNFILIPNLIYRSIATKGDIELSNKNFEGFKNKAFQQSNLLHRFYGLKDSKGEINMIRNQSFVYWKGHRFSNYDKEYVLESDIPFNFYPNDFYFPGDNSENKFKEMNRFFSIEICQDHIEKSKADLYNLSSVIHIVQSATIDLAHHNITKSKCTGLIAHVDSNSSYTEAWRYIGGKGECLKSLASSDLKDFTFKLWNIQTDLKKVNTAKETYLSENILKEINQLY